MSRPARSTAVAPSQAVEQERERRRHRWQVTGFVAFVALLAVIVGIFFWLSRTPKISEEFALDDAVIAMHVEARGNPYVVLVNEEGEVHSARLDGKGVGNRNLVWSEAGLSLGTDEHEYLVTDDGTLIADVDDGDAGRPGSWQRFVTDDGPVAFTSSPRRNTLRFSHVEAGALTTETVDLGYRHPVLAQCHDGLMTVTEQGAAPVTTDAGDAEPLTLMDGVWDLACGEEALYGLDNPDEIAEGVETLRVWDLDGGEPTEFRIRLPEGRFGWQPESAQVHDGQLLWTTGSGLWSIPAPSPDDEPRDIEPTEIVDLGGWFGDYDIIVPASQDGVFAISGETLFTAAIDKERIQPRDRTRGVGTSYTRVRAMAIVRADLGTGESRVAFELGDLDFPRKNVRIDAIAVRPGWEG